MRQEEFEDILGDTGKTIEGDISWKDDEDHSPAVEFRAPVVSAAGDALMIVGSFNKSVQSLTFAIIHRNAGRIYALDMGKDHRNPDGTMVGDLHKHRWTEQHQAKEAYVPADITATVMQPVEVWAQFCLEASITHKGKLSDPPGLHQKSLFT